MGGDALRQPDGAATAVLIFNNVLCDMKTMIFKKDLVFGGIETGMVERFSLKHSDCFAV